MSNRDSTHQNKSKYEKILNFSHRFTSYAHFGKFYVIPFSEWAEHIKNHMIGHIASTLRDDSNGAKCVDLCLSVQKLIKK
jgi:hypothetical protein